MPLDRVSAPRRGMSVHPMAEALEARTVLSDLVWGTGDSLPSQEVEIDVPSAVVSPQAKSLVVTLVRRSTDGSNPSRGGALNVTFQAQPGPQNAPGVVPPFTPVDLPITFHSGQTVQNVTVPLNPALNVPNPYDVRLSVTPATLSASPTSRDVEIVSGPSSAPPTVVKAQVLGGGGVVTGVALTFSQPMDAGRAENRFNYRVVDKSKTINASDVAKFLFLASTPKLSRSVPLSAAVYDASTNTVDLLFRRRQTDLGPYEVTNSPSVSTAPLAARNVHGIEPLTNAQGNQVAQAVSVAVGHGGFDVTVSAPGH